MNLYAEDVTKALAGPSSVVVAFGGTTVGGFFDHTDEQQFLAVEGTAKVFDRVLRVPTGSLPGLARGSVITITEDGVATTYTVRDLLRDNDGLETVVQLVQ